MANPEHLAMLKLGTPGWNRWRAANPATTPDLSAAHLRAAALSRANLAGADLRLTYFGHADLSGAELTGADISQASLRHASLAGASLNRANLAETDLTRADLTGAQFHSAHLAGAYLAAANLSSAVFEDANLAGADLSRSIAVNTNFRKANLSRAHVYGIAAWGLALDGAVQHDLVITPDGENLITADRVEVAQFLYLILNNHAIRDVIQTVGKKAVLILGRFSEDRKPVLDLLRDKVRDCGLVPIVFDFQKPDNRDLTETVSTLAHMARAIIADLTAARSVPQELMSVVPNLPSVPVQPIVAAAEGEYGMFEHFRRYPWVREIFRYQSSAHLLDQLPALLQAFST